MDCSSIHRALAIHHPDHPLPSAIADHLAGCADCRLRYRDDAVVWRILDDYVVPTPAADLVTAILDRVVGDELVARRRTTRTSVRVFAAAAALVIVAGGGLGGWLGIHAGRSTKAPASAASSLVDHAEVFGAAPPGSLASAYASLERGEVSP